MSSQKRPIEVSLPTSDPATSPPTKKPRVGVAGTTIKYHESTSPSTWTFNVRHTPQATTAYIHNVDGSKIQVQLPRCRVPFGVQEPLNATSDKSRPNLELDIADPQLVEWCKEIDQAAIEYVTVHSGELMKREMSIDFVRQLFRPTLPTPRNDYNPLMRTKITRAGQYATNVRVVTNPGSATTPLRHRAATINEIERGDEVLPVVDINSIWFANNSAGMTISLAHVLVYKKSAEVANIFSVDGVAGIELDTGDAPSQPPLNTTDTNELGDEYGDPF